MPEEIFNPKIVKSTKNMQFIELSPGQYVARRTLTGFWKKGRKEYLVYNRNGKNSYTFDSICSGITLGEKEEVEATFNAWATDNDEIITTGEYPS